MVTDASGQWEPSAVHIKTSRIGYILKLLRAHGLDSFYSWELQRISVLWLMAGGAAVTVLHCRHTAMTLTGTLTD